MKANLRVFIPISFLLLLGWSSSGAITDTNGFHLNVELQDGSQLFGKAGDESYQFRSEVLGEMKLPLEKIRSIQCLPKTNLVNLTTATGDKLTAQFLTKEIRINTAFGHVKLPVNLLKNVQISSLNRPPKNRAGLVTLWSGEGNGNDSIGNNNATLTDISFAQGEVGQAFSLNGYTSYFRASYASDFKFGGDGLTITAWIKPTDNAGYHPIIQWTSIGSSYGVTLRIGHSPMDNGVLYADFLDANNNLHDLSSPAGMVAAGKFQFVALTYDRITGRALLYLNGTIVAQTQVNVPMSFDSIDGGFWIGRRNPVGDSPGTWSYNKFFSGLLDEIAIYNRPLSAEEIKAIATEENNGEPLPPPMPNPQRSPFYNGFRSGTGN